MIRKLLVGLCTLALICFPGVAVAHDGVDHSTERETRQHETSDMRSSQDEARQKVCEARAQNITLIMARAVKRAENYGTLLTTITERLETFAGNLGERSIQYDFAQINAAQASFESNLVALKADAEFSCNSSDAKTQVTAFRGANQAVMKDLKEWRAALKTLTAQLRESEVQ